MRGKLECSDKTSQTSFSLDNCFSDIKVYNKMYKYKINVNEPIMPKLLHKNENGETV